MVTHCSLLECVMKKPNAFIIGAPKCGTTALCHYLSQHPEIFVSDPKEPHYFAHQDMPNRKQYFNNPTDYFNLFGPASKNESILLEGSVWYLYCKNAVQRIADHDPKAKIIIMLRRPDEMVYSFHSQALVNFDEDVENFTTAWKMARYPELRQRLPKSCKEPMVIMYDKIARYNEQLQRVYRFFPKSQVHIIFYEDFSQNTSETYAKTLSFLGVDKTHAISFERINENSVVKNRTFGRLIEHPPASFMKAWKLMKRMLSLIHI